MASILSRLESWYQSQCDGDWEHGFGIRIETLDNPGWHVIINIQETSLEDRPEKAVTIDRTETDWLRCYVRDGKYEIACGALNLEEGIAIFLEWAEQPLV